MSRSGPRRAIRQPLVNRAAALLTARSASTNAESGARRGRDGLTAMSGPARVTSPARRRLRAIAAVGAVAALAMAGVAALDVPAKTQTAVPAATTRSTPDLSVRTDRVNRGNGRPSPSPSAASSASSTPPDKESSTPPGKESTLTPDPSSPSPTKGATRGPAAAGTRYTTVGLNVRTHPRDAASLITVLKAGTKITLTDSSTGAWQGIVYRGHERWVHARYLVKSKPATKKSATTKKSSGTGSDGSTTGGISAAACGSSSVERGLTPDAIRVHRAVCHAFPQIMSYGGVRADSMPEHPSGRALDCMLPGMNNALGWRVANWVRAHARELGVSQILFDQHIWTVQRSSEGWRTMSDRGGATANHRDHVHVTVYGSAGTS